MITSKRVALVVVAILTILFFLHSLRSSSPQHSPSDQLPKFVTSTRSSASQLKEDLRASMVEASRFATGKGSAAESLKLSSLQNPLKGLGTRSLREQLEYQFPYDPQSNFPAYIWQTWKHDPSEVSFEEEFRENEISWTQLHPGFVHEVITDDIAVHLLRHLYASLPDVLAAYHALPLPILKADFFRYLILLARGGIYSDIDTAALKPATDWVPAKIPRDSFGMIIGIEADPDRDDWADWYSRRIQFCQWTIQSKPGHPILRDVVANITEETLLRRDRGRLSRDHRGIVDFTGPALWTDIIFKYFNNPSVFDMSTSQGSVTWQHFTRITSAKKVGDVIVLPITSFSPGVKQMGAGEDDDDMAFVKHHFEGTLDDPFTPESLDTINILA
ncbi:hypothetical protein EJ05DRAFT_532171 [Pseudovirgaria hyperparasitica]|uniref:Initiation-specific alpha-1,6-mannosyltransferase n=1 Tax=Pseudovirgaria hyperparasitica TaxID=470096 RepID=A0A6A6W5D5_9PEZI|nr:uncharacterized protein EJ05DRAFT_532171 [Pseudovirgaria hyperparasitica]KAF2757813.1 hypothetical protein EJ05DRAFT_532171 [Pseudovirgaria hyperparasitica]